MAVPPDPDLEAALATLSDLDAKTLRASYKELTGQDLPKHLRLPFTRVVVAHTIREKQSGGLDRPAKQMLDRLVSQIVPGAAPPPPFRNRKIKVGTRLLREWQGRIYEVFVEQDGYSCGEKKFKSLSAIACDITGTKWNGWLFFGVSQQRQKRAAALDLARPLTGNRSKPSPDASSVYSG